jgi:ATP-dependent protease ClpP protease subunit
MLERDQEEAEEGNRNYLERVLSSIMNRQSELDYPPRKKVNYRFSSNLQKRREDVRAVLKELLNYDSFFTAEETVAMGLADKVAE